MHLTSQLRALQTWEEAEIISTPRG
jgi:hypothetical protein